MQKDIYYYPVSFIQKIHSALSTGKSVSHLLTPETDNGQWIKSSLQSAFVVKVVLEHSHINLFVSSLQLLS